MRKITFIILHCSGTRCNRRYTFVHCRKDHIMTKRWKDIGYHYYVELDGSIHKGREESVIGAHVRHHNKHSIGICYEGGLSSDGYPEDTRTKEQKDSLRKLLSELHHRYPEAIILGHRDLSPDYNADGHITPDEYIKQCPCFDALIDYSDLQPEGI